MNPSNVLIIGGAGYIGLAITSRLLEAGLKVTVADNLIYENEAPMRAYLLHDSFTFIKFDYVENSVEEIENLENFDHVVVLAGLVGDPITKNYPNYSEVVNGERLRKIFNDLNQKNIKKVIFTSTCSNYGLIAENDTAKEDHELNPLSLYAKEKVNAERHIIKNSTSFDYQSIILRFSTAFGCAPRMRFDLSVNEFVKDIYEDKTLEIYDADTWRPYCHVRDFGELILRVILSSNIYKGEVFNAGSENNNATKRMIAEMIKKYLPNAKLKYVEGGFDKRNYKVNFEKVRDHFGFDVKWDIEAGIKELILNLQKGMYLNSGENKNEFGNYFLEGKN